MRTFYIHIGTEKTGTTTIQHLLSKNRDHLIENGVCYPNIGYHKNGGAHFKLVAPLCLIEDEKAPLDFVPHCNFTANEVWAEVEEWLRKYPNHDFIISAEHFSSRLKNEGIQFIFNFFKNLNIKISVKILVYLRNQIDFITSAYHTKILGGASFGIKAMYEDAIEGAYYYDYLKIIESWASIFGSENILIKGYDDIIQGKGLLPDLMSLLRLNRQNINLQGSKNQSFHPKAILLARLINEIRTKHKMRLISPKELFELASREFKSQPKPLLNHNQRVHLIHHFMADNKLIEKKYKLKLNQHLNNDNKEHEELTEQEITTLVIKLWNSQASHKT